jgi:hypothetical protein
MWRAVFTPDLTYTILVSVILTIFCIVLYKSWSKRPAGAQGSAIESSRFLDNIE